VRIGAELIAVLVVAVLLYLGWAGWRGADTRRDLRERRDARWTVLDRTEAGQVVVVVALAGPAGRVLEEHVVRRIADEDPDWSAALLAARAEAEERAFHLNAGRGLPPP
jgi:hypothetical protein